MTVQYVLPPAVDRFALIIGALHQAVAARGPVIGVIVCLICTRLSRAGQRFAKLAARVRSGALPAAARAAADPAESCADRQAKRRKSDDPADRRADRRAERLPRGFAWLFRLVPASTALASQMNYLLSDPEMVALLAAAPQMGRLLRPLCQMLGIRLSDHPLLQRTPRRRAAASPADALAPERSSARATQATRRSRRRAARPADASPDAVTPAGVIASTGFVAPTSRRDSALRRAAPAIQTSQRPLGRRSTLGRARPTDQAAQAGVRA